MKSLPHDVYEIFDRNGQALYVGISMNTERRLLQHRRAGWYPFAVEVLISSYTNMAVAKHVEGRRIEESKPLGNSQQERWSAKSRPSGHLLEPTSRKVVKL